MSAFITLATPMIDQECLVQALVDLGFDENKIELHAEPVELIGFDGAGRGRSGHVVIRRWHVGSASNDIGFERTPTGFRAYVSDFDQKNYGRSWMRRLHERYLHHDETKRERLERAAAAEIEERRLAEIEERRRENERLRLVEAQRQAVHEKARALGYRVNETRQGDTIRLVLVKRAY